MQVLPFIVAALFAGALHIVGRRHPLPNYVNSWTIAFELLAATWLLRIGIAAIRPDQGLAGSAPALVGLAACLLFVMGLRQRARRRDRAGVLAAIWAVSAGAMALRSDIWSSDAPSFATSTPLLIGAGLLLAACAVRTWGRRGQASDWVATAILVGYGAVNLLTAWLVLTGSDGVLATLTGSPAFSTLAYVVLGVALMLMLHEDLAVALERVARTDPLTGIWNRRGFDEGAPHLLARLGGSPPPPRAAVAIGDLDAFKAVNDGHGHAVGDAVLVAFARVLAGATADGDILARLGGEEFALLAVGADAQALFDRVELVRDGMMLHAADGAPLPRVTASFGVAALDPATMSLRDALERADRALYRAKQTGRNRSVIDEAGPHRADDRGWRAQ